MIDDAGCFLAGGDREAGFVRSGDAIQGWQ